MMKTKFNIIALFTVLIITTSSMSHVKNALLLEGCGSCHAGHGMTNEPMLKASQEQLCYQCHGSDENRSQMVSTGKLSTAAELADLERVFDKVYRHPVEDGTGHSPTEKLPNFASASITHAECVDCHNPHQRIVGGEKSVHEVSGYSLSGQYLETSIHEYEICFKCHFDNNQISDNGKNSFRDFSLSIRSQHPVTKPTSRKSASLTSSLGAGGLMKCSDCHTNDDPSGPKGPHASNYQFLLSGNYTTDIYADESSYAYQFCYSCHDRSSILNDESFPLHRQHIEGDPIKGIRGTSCFTCHASHSSQSYAHLIEFNLEAVSPDTKTGRLTYIETGTGSGQCFLSCHGKTHSPGVYSR